MTYFEHGQCFIWGILVFSFLVFSIFKYLKFNFSSNFSDLEMLKLWSVNYMCPVCNLCFYLRHVQILDNIYIWVILVNSENVLLLVLVKYMLCNHFTQKLYFFVLFEAKNPCFVTKNWWKSSYICVFILSKKRRNWFHKNLYNSGIVDRRKLPDPSLNHIFNALSIGIISIN